MQNGENYYKMEVKTKTKVKTKSATHKNPSRRWFRPNIWWFIVITLIFISVVFVVAREKTTSTSVYPIAPIVAIDAGHGGIDRGASGFGIFEAEINLAVATMLETALSGLNVQTVQTRTGDYGLYGDTSRGFKKRDMQARKEIVENSAATALISIHMNASSITDRTGVVIYCDVDNPDSLLLANSVASGFEVATVKDGDFFITTKIDTPAVIVECGFITTPSEAYQLSTVEYQQHLANCIARGVLIYQLSLQNI